MQRQECDILIIGGGLIGGNLGLALARLPLKIIMVEQEPLATKPTAAHDERGIALSYTSKKILDSIGIWQEVEKTAEPITKIHVSEQGSFAQTRLAAAELKLDAFGFVCSGIQLGRIINDSLTRQKNIQRLMPSTLQDIDFTNKTVRVLKDDAEIKITAKIIVGADGANSKVRELAAIQHKVKEYTHTAITCNLSFTNKHKGLAFERFTANGPLALLPLTDNYHALIWTMPEAQAQSLLELSANEFKARFYQEFSLRLGKISSMSKLKTYPLRMVTSDALVKANVVLIGNSAQTLHPVAGQGLNLGLRDVSALHERLYTALNNRTKLEEALADYAASRAKDRSGIIQLSDGLVSIFTNKTFLAKSIRRAGLLGFSCLPPMRKIFSSWALGRTPKAARLERGLN